MTTTLQELSTGPAAIKIDFQEEPLTVSKSKSPMASTFQNIRGNYDSAAKTAQALDYWRDVYPLQGRLVVAYIVEAFAALGLDLSRISAGVTVPALSSVTLPKQHHSLVRRFYEVLENEGKLVSSSPDNTYLRTDVPVDPTPSSSLYKSLLGKFPQHDVVHELLNAVGSQLAGCLSGKVDALQLVFGNPQNKKLLKDMYEFWPLLRAPTLLLGEFLAQAVDSHSSGDAGRPFRILEVGAGTGGTTRHLLERLAQSAGRFEYVFTDISTALVAAAKREFKKKFPAQVSSGSMLFESLDIEQDPPKEEYLSKFDVIISSNCIHATKDLNKTLGILKKMLRPESGAAVMLIEMTQRVCWLDVVVGFFGGWWLFEEGGDGREYALIDEEDWAVRMKKAGFSEVLWSEGDAAESKTVRLLGAFV
ncbi:Polyketide methyltransferase sdnL [Naviculisporaceae sp. PSN 640]